MPVFSLTPSFQKYDRFHEPPIRLPYVYRRSCDGELIGECSASFFSQLRCPLQIPRPLRGSYRSPLHRLVFCFANLSQFDPFPILSFPSPASITIAGHSLLCCIVAAAAASQPAGQALCLAKDTSSLALLLALAATAA